MAKFHSLTMTRLKTLTAKTIASFGETTVTNGRIVQAALPEARKICQGDYDAVICGTLSPMVRNTLAGGAKREWTKTISLIPGLDLPYRIAVPPPDLALDPDTIGDDGAEIDWIVLHKATIAEARRNVAMRDAHIAGSMTERDKIQAVVNMAAALTEDENAVIGTVLGRRVA